jgi:putative flippase GtrA
VSFLRLFRRGNSLLVAYSRLSRFIIVGSINTLITWLLFRGLNSFIDYRLSYSVSFAAGIVISYLANAAWVFQQRYSLRSALRYPIVYVVQYIYGLAAIWILVDMIGIARDLSLLVVIGTSIPLTFVLMKLVFRETAATSG